MRSTSLAPRLRVQLDQLPLVVGQPAVGEQHGVREDELADVVQQRGGVDQVLLALVAAQQPRDLAGIAGDRGRVARGHRIAHRERLQHGRQHADLQRPELLGALHQLLPAIVRGHGRAREVVEDAQDDDQQDQRGDPDPVVA